LETLDLLPSERLEYIRASNHAGATGSISEIRQDKFMFGFKKNKSNRENKSTVKEPSAPDGSAQSGGLFARLSQGLSKTRHSIKDNLGDILLGAKRIDDELLEEIEMILLSADLGVDATREIIDQLTQRVKRNQLADADALSDALQELLLDLLKHSEQVFELPQNLEKTFVMLVVGINGAGKTTTIGKLAKRFQQQGHSVMLAAGDTFRAAAVEQLQEWGRRNEVAVVAQQSGADSAAVIFDALQSAQAKNIDVLIADTAGRLHTQSNLMDELKKVARVMSKLDQDAPHEVLLVLDASIGQNAINQAKQFQQAVGVTGIALTKLDGSAKGGVIFAIAKQLGIPIRFIGIGEGIEDLRPFNAEDFVRALFSQENQV